MQRYTIDWNSKKPDDKGLWVPYSDVERLQAEKEGLARRLELAEHVIDATLNDRPDSATVAARNYRRTFKALSATGEGK